MWTKHEPYQWPDMTGKIMCENMITTDTEGLAELGSIHGQSNGKSWMGGMYKDETVQCVRNGDPSAVPASEKLLANFEELVPLSQAWQNTLSVTGGGVNVPVALTGNPHCMIRRRRVASAVGPLSILVDLTSSAAIPADKVRKRGVAILALTRLLSNVRPVEVYVISALGGYSNSKRNSIATRLDTSPLDLARAAHLISHTSISRCLGYGILQGLLNADNGWGFGSFGVHSKTGKQAYTAMLAPANDVLFVPPIFMTDPLIENPVKWIQERITEYAGDMLAA